MRYDAGTWARADQMRASGLSDYEVGRRLGIPRSTVYNHFARAGLARGAAPPRSDGDVSGSSWAALIVLGVVLLFSWLDHRARKGKWTRGYMGGLTRAADNERTGDDRETPPPPR